MSKGIYVGKLSDVPIYGTEMVNVPWSFDNFDSFFHTSVSDYIGYTANGNYVKFAITQGTIAQQITLTALYNLTNVTIQYYYRSTMFSKITITINGVSQNLSTSSSVLSLNPINLSAGDIIDITLSRSMTSASYNPYFQIKCDNISIENKVITGYEQKEVARKVKKLYGSVDDIARRIVKGYIGARAPIYGTTTVETAIPFEYTNMDKIFSYSTLENELVISDGKYGIKFSPEPNVTSNQVFTDTYTLLTDLTNVRIYCNLRNVDADQGESWVEINGDYFDNTQDGLLGTISSLSAGSTIEVAIYHETSGDYSTFEIVADDPITTKEVQIITGYEDKVTPRLFYTSLGINYDGTNSMEEITVNGVPYDLYTITDSGILTLTEATQYWACAGGGGGGVVSSNLKEASGGGGGGYFSQGILESGTYTIAIGAGGASTTTGAGTTITPIENNTVGNIISIAGGNSSTTRDGGDGGSGGGGGGYRSGNFTYEGAGGTGSGSSTYPFGIESLKAHCAGGGGGSYYSAQNACTNGGDGGSNGGNGEDGVDSYLTTSGSIGGEYGGGNGGKHGVDGSNGTFYGAGGGAGGMDKESGIYGTSGTGYQGVMYLLVPA